MGGDDVFVEFDDGGVVVRVCDGRGVGGRVYLGV